MSILNRPEHGNVTASAGSASVNINTKNDLCYQILLKAATSSTTFDASLTDIHGNVIWAVEDVTGEHSELLVLPTYGNWTLDISNASADEQIDYLFNFREK